MKPLVLAVLILAFGMLLAGCLQGGSGPSATATPSIAVSITPTPTPTPSASVASASECRIDSDCIATGCSGQVCQPNNKPPAVTTCEYKDEYACYQPEGCICRSGQCAWGEDTLSCVRSFYAPAGKDDAQTRCVQLCRVAKSAEADLSNGPCLSNEVAPGWVCDVAHDPRQEVDNQEQNTCPAFGNTAQHFVEVDENCRVIIVN